MNANTRFEIVAHAFQKDTGYMAPGKSVPDCMAQDEAARNAEWLKWYQANEGIIKNLLSSVDYILNIEELEENLRQARIAEQAAYNERNKIELLTRRETVAEMSDLAHREALRLAKGMWRAVQDECPNWQPLETTAGLISQIDNMYAGMRASRDWWRFEAQSVQNQLTDIIETHNIQP